MEHAQQPRTTDQLSVQKIGLGRRSAALLLGTLFLGASAMSASAVSPITPRLSAETRAELLTGLARANLPKEARNSVVIAIAGALGFEATDGPINYSTAYAHLPTVEGHVTRVSETCARVEAHAWLPRERETEAVSVEGTYCLVGPAEWTSLRQEVRRLRT